MKLKLLQFQTTTILLIIVALSIAVATFIEADAGAEIARKYVYNALWFEVALTLLTLNMAGSLFYYKSFTWRKITVPLYHLAFVLIMVGAFLTRYTGMEGTVIIREGASSSEVILDEEYKVDMPFEITLDNFELERYPGSNSPSSFSSYVTVVDKQKDKTFDFHIYMNHILKYRGWRFFQTSYDQDEMGTVLTASRDIFGTPMTYAGYILSIITMFISLFMPGTYFRRQLKKLKSVAVILLLFALPFATSAKDIDQSSIVPADKAAEFGKLVIQDTKGRMKVLNTLNKEFMRKIYGNEKFEKLTPDQVVLSLITFPEFWSTYDIIKLKDKDERAEFASGEKYASYNGMFDANGQYLLMSKINKIFMKPQKMQSKTEKNYIDLDDRVNIVNGFLSGNAYALFPIQNATNHKWYNAAHAFEYATNPQDSVFLRHIFSLYLQEVRNGVETGDFSHADEYLNSIKLYQKKMGASVYPSASKIKAELYYNKTDMFNRLKNGYGLVGFIMLIVFLVNIFTGKEYGKIVRVTFYGVAVIFLLFHMIGIGLRWYIGGFVPLSNAYEAMLYVSCIAMLAGFIMSLKQQVILSLSMIMSFMFLFVASLSSNNPEIGNLVPVLKSYWLSIHVAVITSSYALFSLIMMVSLINLVIYLFLNKKNNAKLMQRTTQMGVMMQVLLTIGLYLLTIGTILGAIWANESWGRYWGWDPKETWALISVLVYAFVAHMRLIPSIKGEFWFNMASFWAFASILMTFFGVNYFLTGMHSYAGTSEAVVPSWLKWAVIGFVVFTIASGMKYFKMNKHEGLK